MPSEICRPRLRPRKTLNKANFRNIHTKIWFHRSSNPAIGLYRGNNVRILCRKISLFKISQVNHNYPITLFIFLKEAQIQFISIWYRSPEIRRLFVSFFNSARPSLERHTCRTSREVALSIFELAFTYKKLAPIYINLAHDTLHLATSPMSYLFTDHSRLHPLKSTELSQSQLPLPILLA
jgi:hypothetical protein